MPQNMCAYCDLIYCCTFLRSFVVSSLKMAR